MRSKYAVLYLLILLFPASFLSMYSETTLAPPVIPPYITSVNPHKIITSYPPFPAEIHIKGGGFIPAGSPLEELNYQKIYMRYSNTTQWLAAPLKIPGPYGRGANLFTAQLPAFNYVPGFIQIKVVVHGRESKVFNLPVVAPDPPKIPKILSVSPSETAIGQTEYYFCLKVYATGIDNHTVGIFQGKSQDHNLRNYTEGYIMVYPLQEIRNKPGRYTIQLKNDLGYSNFVFWDLVIKPRIVKIDPDRIMPSMLTPSSQPVTIKITFEKSPPKTILYRIDNGSWNITSSFKIIGYSAHIKLNLAVLKPKKNINIKLSNKAGESNIVSMKVMTLIPLKLKNIRIHKNFGV